MPSQTVPHCFDLLSTDNFIELQDELYKGGMMEFYHQRCQTQLAAECTESSLDRCRGPQTEPVSPHTPAPSSPPVNGSYTTAAAQVYVKSIIEKLAKDSAQDERLARDFVNAKFAFVMQLRVLFNWVFRLMGILHKSPTLETHKDIARAYHSKLLAYRRGKFIFDARGFMCMKALVIVDDLINHLSSKESVLQYLGVIYYFTGRELLRMAHDNISWYPNLLVTLFQRVDDRLMKEMNANKCQISDIIESLDKSLFRSIIELEQRTLVLGVQEFQTCYLEDIEATWACYRDLQQEDIIRFGELWEWMAGRKLHLKLGIGETTYPLPEQDLAYHRENLRRAVIAFGERVESDGTEEDLDQDNHQELDPSGGSVETDITEDDPDQDIGQDLHSSDLSIRRVGPGEELGYHYFPELGHAMLCIGKKSESNGIAD